MKLCVFIHRTKGQQWRTFAMADLPQTRDMSRQMTFPWSAAHKSIACEHLTIR